MEQKPVKHTFDVLFQDQVTARRIPAVVEAETEREAIQLAEAEARKEVPDLHNYIVASITQRS